MATIFTRIANGEIPSYKVAENDDFYAFPCPTTITVKEPDSVDKFFGKDVVYTHTLDTIEDGVVTYTFEELFDVDDTYSIKAITVGGDGTFENGVFTFEGTGTFTVTATDNFYCNHHRKRTCKRRQIYR